MKLISGLKRELPGHFVLDEDAQIDPLTSGMILANSEARMG
jgi:hypothetical protein